MNCVLKGQFYKGIIGKCPNLYCNEVCYKGTVPYNEVSFITLCLGFKKIFLTLVSPFLAIHDNCCLLGHLLMVFSILYCSNIKPDQAPHLEQFDPVSSMVKQSGVHLNIIEPRHKISKNVVCGTSKASYQPVHTHSPIRAFACRLNIL